MSANHLGFLQALELREDLALELVPVEDERPHLDWPEPGQPVEHRLERQLAFRWHVHPGNLREARRA